MIETVVEQWHAFMKGQGSLDELLHPDCVFYSPVVYTPQRGREVTKAYLEAAGSVFGGEPGGSGETAESGSNGDDGFRYRTTVISGTTAVLEFETTMGGTYVNGVDMITCDDEGRITEFKVMLRPLQAVNLVHSMMAKALEAKAAG